MTDTEMLREKIEQSGYKLRFIAQKIGITYQAFLNKINNRSEFRANENQALYVLLGLTEEERVEIFFTRKVD
ncbi:MAG: toxin-antitoxin system, antitoxin component, Xre family protein [Oscillospiraceae bacterium]|nr:toxin-antitoxin system, antitoxin component, Xre family protein [Oscillospiraceae bacterium]